MFMTRHARIMHAATKGSAKAQFIASQIEDLDYEASMLLSEAQAVAKTDPVFAKSIRKDIQKNRRKASALLRKI